MIGRITSGGMLTACAATKELVEAYRIGVPSRGIRNLRRDEISRRA
jgi:hypothetical protein